MRSSRLLVRVASALLLIGAVVAALLWRHPELLGVRAGSEEQSTGLLWVAGLGSLMALLLMVYRWFGRGAGQQAYRDESADDAAPIKQSETLQAEAELQRDLRVIREKMRTDYGTAWRLKVRLLLVVGEPAEVDGIAPGISTARWLEGKDTLLLYGGSVQGTWLAGTVGLLKGLRPRRPLDGIVWALALEQAHLEVGVRQLQGLARQLRWQAPLYLWQVCGSGWEQQSRGNPAVGCLLPPGASAQRLESELRQLLIPLRAQGLERMNSASSQDFLLRLSRDLNESDIARWRDALAQLLPRFARGVSLRGLLFSLAQPPVGEAQGKNSWWPLPAWDAIREDRQARGRRFGWTWLRGAQVAALGCIGLCALALLLSFASNRSQIATVETALAAVNTPVDLDAQLTALRALTRELTRLEQRQQHGVPWYQRLGLSQNDALLAALWPHYVQANNKLLRDVGAQALAQQLAHLAALPADSPELAERAQGARNQLKAYLMMSLPEKAEGKFLGKQLRKITAERRDVSAEAWQALAPELWDFYAEHLPTHPEWRIATDDALIAQARQALLGQLDQPAAEQALYQQLLQRAGKQYVALGLASLVAEKEATALFDTPDSVPGAFTRQAWDGYLRDAIDKIGETRREELDWVLSDPQHPLAAELQPEALKARLTERYFSDFSQAWLTFLNSIRWQKAKSQAEAVDQLTLLADTRRSPLVALMKELADQGTTGTSAGTGAAKGQAVVAMTPATVALLPMEQTFGPLLAMQGKARSAAGNQASLPSYLTRVTQVRTRLQRVESAADPRAMAQTLAQATFQGLTLDNEDYGQVVVQSLGKPLAAFAQNLFVLPLGQAWSGVLQASAGDLNRQWQRAIVARWQRDFNGRYPFVANGADAPLPMLGQMIRTGGHIDRFIANELTGVLRKQGKRWVPVGGEGQGVRINPAFLVAVNRLGELADALYSDGAMRMSFELKAKPVRDVVETTLIIDGERLEYFNQMESWKTFTWPSQNDHPGVMLTWNSVKAGVRLYGDYSGPWALLRLLEQGKVTSLAGSGSPYQFVLTAPDGLPLTWQLRTQRGGGPLELLRLRDFKLPQEVLLSTSQNAAYAVGARK
ncbi:ImcF-related family protein [Pseudomonas nicosulfuronedens]